MVALLTLLVSVTLMWMRSVSRSDTIQVYLKPVYVALSSNFAETELTVIVGMSGAGIPLYSTSRSRPWFNWSTFGFGYDYFTDTSVAFTGATLTIPYFAWVALLAAGAIACALRSRRELNHGGFPVAPAKTDGGEPDPSDNFANS